MFFRLVQFWLWLLVGAFAGNVLIDSMFTSHGALVGAGLSAFIWSILDATRSAKLLAWLRPDARRLELSLPGVWGEIADRARRLLGAQDKVIGLEQARLQDFLSALQASPNGVVLLDQDARIEWCNQRAALHFGLDAKRDVAQVIGNLVRDPTFGNYLNERNFSHSVIMSGRGQSFSQPMSLSVQLHPYGEGRMLLLSTDITAFEQAEAMRRDFVANVSHEIRTPLTVLAGFVETLQTFDFQEVERQHFLGLMSQQALRMQTLVSDLLTLSKLEGSPLPSLDTHVNVSTLIRQVKEDALALSQIMAGAQGYDHQFVFDVNFAGDLVGNSSELLSAMGNLVSNAVRYTPCNGQIHVRLSLRDDGGLKFSVSDTGPGIAPEHIGRLTERFYRVDRSRSRETGGTGLGLAIVKHVAQRHGATLNIESKVGTGSVFTLTFPEHRVVCR